MKLLRVPSLLLAGLLHFAPVAKVLEAALPLQSSPIAVVLKWLAATVAVAGSLHSVSGASATITSAKERTATVGVSFTYRITVSGGGSDCCSPEVYAASPVPSGLTFSTSTGVLTGKPTQSGIFNINLQAWEHADKKGTSATGTLKLTVADNLSLPQITAHPGNQSAAVGGIATFSVTATGGGTLTYTWIKDGFELPNSNNSTLTLNPVKAGDAGSYTVRVSNSAGNALSNPATLTIIEPPVITTQPVAQTVNQGGSATFTVAATGTGPLAYQWRRNGDDVPGATGSSLTLNSVTAANEGDYTVRVSNAAGNAISDPARLTVIIPPAITQQPGGQKILAGGTAVFTVGFTGSEPLTFEWRKGNQPVTGGNTATLTLTGVTAGDAGDYTVTLSNSAGTATSAPATLVVATPPTITTHPVGATVHPDTSVTLSVVAEADGPLTYQWRRNDADVPGATGTQLVLAPPLGDVGGNYTVAVTANDFSTTSEIAAVTIVPVALALPAINGSGFAVTFPTLAGRNYVVEANNGLAVGGWSKLQDVTGTGEPATVNDPDNGQTFRAWRLILKAP